jgi:excisionase family DNA binding protein
MTEPSSFLPDCSADFSTASTSHQRLAVMPLAYSVDEFARAASVGRDKIYDAIREGRLTARKIGARTVILDEDGRAWLRQLPTMPRQAA